MCDNVRAPRYSAICLPGENISILQFPLFVAVTKGVSWQKELESGQRSWSLAKKVETGKKLVEASEKSFEPGVKRAVTTCHTTTLFYFYQKEL